MIPSDFESQHRADDPPDENPYQPTIVESDGEPGADRSQYHYWNGRRVAVSAAAIPSHLFLVVGYFVTIDDKETFTSRKLTFNEKFEFSFDHQGAAVTGRFESFGVFGNRYRLYIDEELIATSKLAIKGWQYNVVAAGLIGLFVPVIFYLMLFSLWYVLFR